ncbi:chemerin-like receptor 1 [Ruditapes philippinarum]|uniref:chemerin-like receptor 1 n=1 Tax=Ruditapes philippinarum TaxID=129788 RepID=UPI00295BBEE8|nr:chemerin-like receptor 1 [Ruditapes philippinarum]
MFVNTTPITNITTEINQDYLRTYMNTTEGNPFQGNNSDSYGENGTKTPCKVFNSISYGDNNAGTFEAKIIEILTYFPITIWIGSLPNILIICILMKKRNRKFSTAVFLMSLAVADLANGCVTLMFWLQDNRFIEESYSKIDCVLRNYIGIVFIMVSNWLLAVISVERCICVVYPFDVKKICSVTVSMIAVIMVWVAAFIVEAMLFWSNFKIEYNTDIQYDYEDCFAEESDDMAPKVCNVDYISEWHNQFHGIIQPSIIVFLPYSIIMIFSCIIIYSLKKEEIQNRKTATVVNAILTLNAIFLVTNLPELVVEFLWLSGYAVNEVVETVAFRLRELNFIANFFVYFLSGSRYKTEVKDLFARA